MLLGYINIGRHTELLHEMDTSISFSGQGYICCGTVVAQVPPPQIVHLNQLDLIQLNNTTIIKHWQLQPFFHLEYRTCLHGLLCKQETLSHWFSITFSLSWTDHLWELLPAYCLPFPGTLLLHLSGRPRQGSRKPSHTEDLCLCTLW